MENKIDHIAKDKDVNNINAVEEAFDFNTISSVNELEQFEQKLKNEDFFMKMVNVFLYIIIRFVLYN